MVRADNMHYLTAKKLNKSDDKLIEVFDELNPKIIDEESGIRGIKIEKPSSTNYLFFSKELQKKQLKSRARKVQRQIEEAKAIQESLDNDKKLPKRFQINNLLVDVDYSLQTKLIELSEDEAVELLESKTIAGTDSWSPNEKLFNKMCSERGVLEPIAGLVEG